jgi:hypothetical protein
MSTYASVACNGHSPGFQNELIIGLMSEPPIDRIGHDGFCCVLTHEDALCAARLVVDVPGAAGITLRRSYLEHLRSQFDEQYSTSMARYMQDLDHCDRPEVA